LGKKAPEKNSYFLGKIKVLKEGVSREYAEKPPRERGRKGREKCVFFAEEQLR